MITSFLHKSTVALAALFFAQFGITYGQEVKPTQSKKNLVNFEDQLSWHEILQKAKKESKCIFLDCYTTWCGPCKRMDAEVYTDSSVAVALNKDFINVKMQMDKTAADNKAVKARYKDLDFIAKNYDIVGYPTLIFFNPNGEIAVKHTGYLRSKKLIDSAATSKLAGRVFYDAEKELKLAIIKYQQGQEDLGKLQHLIDMANGAQKKEVEDSLKQTYLNIVRDLEDKKIYQQRVLTVIGNTKLKENDPLLRLFYPDGTKADAIAGQGFSRFVIDRYIRKTYFEKTIHSKNSSLESLDSIGQDIASKFSSPYVKRGVLAAKLQWASLRLKDELVLAYFIEMLNSFGPESMSIYGYRRSSEYSFSMAEQIVAISMNAICWELIFLNPSSNEVLDWGINEMKKIVIQGKRDSALWNGYTFDTYANLLYKRGNVNDAIHYQKEAIDFCKANLDVWGENYRAGLDRTLAKMKNGTPTWPQPK